MFFVDRAAAVQPFVTVFGSTLAAGREAGEYDGVPGTSGTHSIWYQWTASTAGSFSVTTADSNFDTVLAVYRKVDSTLAHAVLVRAVCPSCLADAFIGYVTALLSSRVPH